MRIQPEYMSFKNRWRISSSYEFQAHQQRFQRRSCFSQTALLWFEVLPDMLPALPGALLWTATNRLGDGMRLILPQGVWGSVRAIRAVRNTRVLLPETRVVADGISLHLHKHFQRLHYIYTILTFRLITLLTCLLSSKIPLIVLKFHL